MNPSEALAQFVARSRFSDLPKEVVQKSKELILDSVGCALGAVQTPEGKTHQTLSSALGGPPESSIPGLRERVSMLTAAYVNSQLANLLDFDDTYDFFRPGHPGCHVIQAALAIGEAVGATGQDLIAAVTAGYEVTMRVGKAQGSLLWHSGYIQFASAIGPAVAAAKLLELSAEQTKTTFDILSAMGALWLGPARGKYDVASSELVGSVKGDNGMASMQGILAAVQAETGLTGCRGMLDLDLKDWYIAGLPEDGYAELTAGLGEDFQISRMSLKPTPSCRWTHVPITAAWEALGGKPVDVGHVARIIVRGVERLRRYEWETMLDAQFSIPCALSLSISRGQPGPDWYTTGHFKSPEIRALAQKVEYEHDPEAEALEIRTGKMKCEVEIRFADGTVRSARIDRIKGAPSNPLTSEEMAAKFRANASFLDPARVSRAMDRLMSLERERNVADLMKDVYLA